MKKLKIIYKITNLVAIVLFLVTLLVAFIDNGISGLHDILLAFRYLFRSISFLPAWQIASIVIAVLIFLSFVVFWTICNYRAKKVSYGPVIFTLFVIMFIFANCYYNIVFRFDAYLVSTFILLIFMLLNVVLSIVIYTMEE